MQAEKNARGLAVEGAILGFMKKWGGGSLGTLGIPGTFWLQGFPSVPWSSSGPQGSPPCDYVCEGICMRIVVSACLLGESCRYDGRSKPCARVQELAVDGHELVPICPEVMGGLPTPRTPCEIVRAPWMKSKKARTANERSWTILDASGADRAAAYARGAQAELARAKEAGCELAILKAKSPSCGSGEVYDGTFSGTLVPGWGIAAATFRDAGITVIDETADFSRLANG